MQAPHGFNVVGDVIRCWICRREWHIPEGMTSLSLQAEALLVDHQELHRAGVNVYRGRGRIRIRDSVPFAWRRKKR